jgi:hypothetical protein
VVQALGVALLATVLSGALSHEQDLRGFEQAYKITFFAALIALIIGLRLPGWPGNWTIRSAKK